MVRDINLHKMSLQFFDQVQRNLFLRNQKSFLILDHDFLEYLVDRG